MTFVAVLFSLRLRLFLQPIPHGLMARILGFHPRGPGSIPGVGEHLFLKLFCVTVNMVKNVCKLVLEKRKKIENQTMKHGQWKNLGIDEILFVHHFTILYVTLFFSRLSNLLLYNDKK